MRSAACGSESTRSTASATACADQGTQTPAPLSSSTALCSGWSFATTGLPSAMYSTNLVGDVDSKTCEGKKGYAQTAAPATRPCAYFIGSIPEISTASASPC